MPIAATAPTKTRKHWSIDQAQSRYRPAGVRERRSRSDPKAIRRSATAPTDLRFADPLIMEIRQLWRRRQAWHRSEKSLTLAASAMCRSYVGVQGKKDKVNLKKAAALLKRIESGKDHSSAAIACLPLLAARAQIEPQRAAVEKTLANLAKQLPIAHVVKATSGFGYGSLAAIVGEAGDLSAYRSLRGLWKRMGVAVINGERQRCKTDTAAALEHGYNPARRSVLWNIGSGLIGRMGKGPRPMVDEDISKRNDLSQWQKLFLTRLRFEAGRDASHRRANAKRKGKTYESFSKHAANRAKRYVEKQFLEALRSAWRSTKLEAREVHEENLAQARQNSAA